jgi:hypothetical protein
MRGLKNIGKRLLRFQLSAAQWIGVDILPRHFYSEVPDIAKLRRTSSWRRAYSLEAIQGSDCDQQLDFARKVAGAVALATEGPKIYTEACKANGEAGFGPIEAQFLYAYVIARKPKAILQIGAGASTSVILQAARHAGYVPSVTCIDPFPTEFIRKLKACGSVQLIEFPVEDQSPQLLRCLVAGDLLFIDSTHTLGPAGEVTRLILEWLPLINVGVEVHFHDITIPYDYQPDILDDGLFFGHETALLMAFLSMNPCFKILCSMSLLHHQRQSEFKELFGGYDPQPMRDGARTAVGKFPSSTYLERIR